MFKEAKSATRNAFTFMFLIVVTTSIVASTYFIERTEAFSPVPIPEKLPVNLAYIRSDGSIDPPTMPIERVGNMYVLTEDILNCSIAIEKDDVEIDGNGFLMAIPLYGEKDAEGFVKSVPSLIDISECTNVTVRNFNFDHAAMALRIWNSSEITTLDNEITNCKWGLILSESTRCYVIGNTLEDNDYGIYGPKSNDISFKYNQFFNCSTGIEAYFSNSSIIGNIFINCGTAIDCLEYHNRVIGNTFQENTRGITSIRANNEIHHNNFIDNSKDVNLQSSNILDDGKEGNYWSSHPYSEQLVVPSRSTRDEPDIDHFPQTSPFIFDYQPPDILIISPENRTHTNGNICINFTASKETPRVRYSINGNNSITLQEDTVLTGLPEGTYHLTVYAEDVFGNEGTTTVTFTIRAANDYLTLILAVAIPVITIASILLLLKLKHRNSKASNKIS